MPPLIQWLLVLCSASIAGAILSFAVFGASYTKAQLRGGFFLLMMLPMTLRWMQYETGAAQAAAWAMLTLGLMAGVQLVRRYREKP